MAGPRYIRARFRLRLKSRLSHIFETLRGSQLAPITVSNQLTPITVSDQLTPITISNQLTPITILRSRVG